MKVLPEYRLIRTSRSWLRRPALKIAGLYALFGGLWIVFSDTILLWMLHGIADPQIVTRLHTIKGWFFIAVTTGLLYLIIQRNMEAIQSSEKSAREYEEVFLQDNEIHTYISLKFPLLDAAGEPYAVCGISTDITDRKQVEKNLQESEGKFHNLADNTSAGIFIYQHDRMVYVKSAGLKLSGYSCAELLAQKFWDIVHPDFREIVKERGLARQQGRPGPANYECKIITKDGAEKWMDLTLGTIVINGQNEG